MRQLLVTFSIFALASEGLCQVPVVSIAGQPFSADEVIVRNSKPNVGNLLPMKTIRVYRDSAGRTREDVSIPRDPIATPFVNIIDPLAGISYSLDTEKKIARRLLYPKPWTPPVNPPEGGVISSFKFICRTTSETLGTKILEGMVAYGKSITSVCDENIAVNESWYSPELKMILLEKTSNSLWDGTTRLEHINRDEPDSYLFQPPSDYTIVGYIGTSPSNSYRGSLITEILAHSGEAERSFRGGRGKFFNDRWSCSARTIVPGPATAV